LRQQSERGEIKSKDNSSALRLRCDAASVICQLQMTLTPLHGERLDQPSIVFAVTKRPASDVSSAVATAIVIMNAIAMLGLNDLG